MPVKDKRPASVWSRIPPIVQGVTAALTLLSTAAGVWFLWPQVRDSIWGKPLMLSIGYDYVVVPAKSLHCVLDSSMLTDIGGKPIGVLQNQCQTEVVAGAPANDMFRVWYLRAVNKGPEIPRVVIEQEPQRQSAFALKEGGDATLVCLGYEGRQGRPSLDWAIASMQLRGADGQVAQNLTVRPAPKPEELKGEPSGCGAVWEGYPPV